MLSMWAKVICISYRSKKWHSIPPANSHLPIIIVKINGSVEIRYEQMSCMGSFKRSWSIAYDGHGELVGHNVSVEIYARYACLY